MKGGDSVLLKDHTANIWDSKCSGDYRFLTFLEKIPAEVFALTRKSKVVLILNVKYFLPAGRVTANLPDYQSLNRQSKYLNRG